MKKLQKKGGFTLQEILVVACTILAICALLTSPRATSTQATTASMTPAIGHAGPDAIPIVGMTNPKLNIDVIGATANYKQIGLATTGTNDRGFDRIFPNYSASAIIYSNKSAAMEVSCTAGKSSSFIGGAVPGLINYG